MASNKLKQSAAALTDALKALNQLEDKETQCREAMKAEIGVSEQIDVLVRRRSEAEGQAFLAGGNADLKAINRQIAELETTARTVRNTAQAAESALALLAPQMAEARQRIVACQEAHRTAITEELESICAEAEKGYCDAANEIKAHLARMRAAAGLINPMNTGGRMAIANMLIDSLSGRATGMIQNGLNTKKGEARYGLDAELWDSLGARTLKAREDILGYLADQGARL